MPTRRPPDAVKPRLILVDDHRMFVEGLRSSLAASYDIVGVGYDGNELLTLLKTRSADCLLLDLQLPDRHGINLIPDVLALQPELRILVVTMFLDRCLADAALAAGAHGFIPKDAGCNELKCAITEVLAGHKHVSPRMPKTSHCLSLDAPHTGVQRLTPRQEEVFRLLGEGSSELEIAQVLRVGPSTVTFHKHSIQRALGLPTDSDLVRYAVLMRPCLGRAARTTTSGEPAPGGSSAAKPKARSTRNRAARITCP